MARQTITRSQLSEAVYQEVGLSRNESAELLESILSKISETLANEESVNIFVSALLSVYRDMANDPTIVRRETNPDGPIGELPEEVLAELDGFYADAVEQLQDKSVGFVAINGLDYMNSKWGHQINANHVHGACGCTTAEKLEEIVADRGEIPHAHLDGMEDKRRQILEGELSFTPWFEHQGYRFEMIKGEKPFTRWCHPGAGTIGLDESKWGPGSCTWILQNDDRLK